MAAKRLAVVLLLFVGGCATFQKMASDAGSAAAGELYERVKADVPDPAPDGSEELWVAMAGVLAVIGQRYWYRWRAKAKSK